MMLGSAQSEHPKLAKHEIIFKKFQRVITMLQRHGRADNLLWQYRAPRSA